MVAIAESMNQTATVNSRLVGVALNVAEVQSALQHDAEFFIQFFMGEELDKPVPEFHKAIFYEMTHQDVKRYVCAIPRDHAKTTLAKLACLWYFLFSDFRFILYISNTHSIAVPCVNDIVTWLETPNFQAVFGAVEWEIKRDGEGIYKFRIPSLNKTCILRAHGAGQQVRGVNVTHQRPQLAVVDDLEDVDPQSGNINTEEQFRALKRWFYGSFRKALDKFKHKIIQLGNMLQRMSLLWEHVHSPYWFSRLYGCLLSNGKPLWPDAWTVVALKEDFEEYQQAGLADLWFAEMMNTPMAPGGGIIQAHEICYHAPRVPDDVEYGFFTVDLAISRQTWAHRTVVVAHGWVPEIGKWQVLEYREWKGIDPIELFKQILAMMNHWKIWLCGIESVAFQAALAPIYEYLARLQQMHHVTFIPVAVGNQAKSARIISWAGMAKQTEEHEAMYALTAGDFAATQQLLQYNPIKKENDDDVIDAIALGVIMIQFHMAAILSQQRGIQLQVEPQTGYQISPV